jgi:hypothetical protein
MKNKRLLVIGVTLILLALVAGVAFASNSKDGVIWVVIHGKSSRLGSRQTSTVYTEFYNDNDYAVRANLQFDRITQSGDYDFAAKETKHFNGEGRVSSVKKR